MSGRWLTALALAWGAWPLTIAAQTCVAPGANVSVPTSGLSLGQPPALVVAFPSSRTRVRVTRTTNSRTFFQMPLTNVPSGAPFAVFALDNSTGQFTGNTGITGLGGLIGGRIPNTRGDKPLPDRDEFSETESNGPQQPGKPGSGGGSGGGGGAGGGTGGGTGGGSGGGSGGGHGGNNSGNGHASLNLVQPNIALSPFREVFDFLPEPNAQPYILAQASPAGPQGVASGQTCGSAGQGSGAGNQSPMSGAAVAVSLGIGSKGLPARYRAGENVLPAPSGAPEYVISFQSSDRRAVLNIVASLGGNTVGRQRLTNLGLELVSVDLFGAVSVDELRALLAFEGINATVDEHHLYETSQGRRIYANDLVGAVPINRCRLPKKIRVGIIDGPIDRTNPYLNGLRIRSFSSLRSGQVAGAADHATGIASILAAQPTTQGFGGIAPDAVLLSAEAFTAFSSRDAASVESISRSINWLLSERAAVINMSIAGPFNRVLSHIIEAASKRRVILVAASGNDGTAQVAYPGTDPNVIAVTAVDAAKRLYRDASFGAEVEFAAPGVDVLVAEGGGTAYRTGTSYAAAVVSGVIAHTLAKRRGAASVGRLRDELRSSSEDLGTTGRDPRFGWGLVHLSGCDF